MLIREIELPEGLRDNALSLQLSDEFKKIMHNLVEDMGRIPDSPDGDRILSAYKNNIMLLLTISDALYNADRVTKKNSETQ